MTYNNTIYHYHIIIITIPDLVPSNVKYPLLRISLQLEIKRWFQCCVFHYPLPCCLRLLSKNIHPPCSCAHVTRLLFLFWPMLPASTVRPYFVNNRKLRQDLDPVLPWPCRASVTGSVILILILSVNLRRKTYSVCFKTGCHGLGPCPMTFGLCRQMLHDTVA